MCKNPLALPSPAKCLTRGREGERGRRGREGEEERERERERFSIISTLKHGLKKIVTSGVYIYIFSDTKAIYAHGTKLGKF